MEFSYSLAPTFLITIRDEKKGGIPEKNDMNGEEKKRK